MRPTSLTRGLYAAAALILAAPAPAVAQSNKTIVINHSVWACPTVEMFRKFLRAVNETAEKDRATLALRAHFEWDCELFTAGNELYVYSTEGLFTKVRKRGDIKDFWTLTAMVVGK